MPEAEAELAPQLLLLELWGSVELVAVETQLMKILRAQMELLILAVAVAVAAQVGLQQEMAAQAAQVSSFSNGPSPYKSQIPLHLPVHG
jgi:hypothetical protein